MLEKKKDVLFPNHPAVKSIVVCLHLHGCLLNLMMVTVTSTFVQTTFVMKKGMLKVKRHLNVLYKKEHVDGEGPKALTDRRHR